MTYSAWWLFDCGRVFHNGSYGVVLAWRDRELVHRLGIFPGWFRFPFMGRDDLQMGDLWTAPDHRGRGLATCALRFAMRSRAGAAHRMFWYLTHESNEASVRTAERAGLLLAGRATRKRRWGLRALGRFEIESR